MGASGGEGLKAEGTQPGERRGKRVIKKLENTVQRKSHVHDFYQVIYQNVRRKGTKKGIYI